jgi:hypothetical protein
MKYTMRNVAGGAARAICHNAVRGLVVATLAALALGSSARSQATANTSAQVAIRAIGVGSYSFSAFFNYSPYSNGFQIVQGSLWVNAPIAAGDLTFEQLADGTKVAHIVKDTYLNGMTAYPVRVYVDVKMTNSTYKAGTVRWVIANRPGVAVQRTWMTSSTMTTSADGYLKNLVATIVNF